VAAVQVVAGWDALAAAITAGAAPPMALSSPRFYRDGAVPSNAPLGYYLLGMVLEDPAGFYDRSLGGSAVYRIHCWADTSTNALRLYAWLFGLLHNVTLTLDGHEVWECKVRLVGTGRDQSSTAQQAIAEVRMESVAA
jgi:hypothetical protein